MKKTNNLEKITEDKDIIQNLKDIMANALNLGARATYIPILTMGSFYAGYLLGSDYDILTGVLSGSSIWALLVLQGSVKDYSPEITERINDIKSSYESLKINLKNRF